MKCKICGNEFKMKSFKVREMMFGFHETFDYFECSKCGCLQISKIPQDMSKYYPADYYSFLNLRKSYITKVKRIIGKKRDKDIITGNGILGLLLNKWYPSNFQFLNKANIGFDSKILDVGCGNGKLLLLLYDIGFRNLTGIDPYIEEDIEYENGIRVLKKYISDLNIEFDLIMFNHSFEHIPNPCETLTSVSRLLSKDGVCILRIPTVSSFAWEKYKVNWVQLDAPRHIFLYSIDSIKVLASNSGMYLKEYYYDSTAIQFWGSEQYLRNITLNSPESFSNNPRKSIFSKKEIKSFKKLSEELNRNNQGDQVILYLKKLMQ